MTNEILSIKTAKDYAALTEHLNMISEIEATLARGSNLADIIWDMESQSKISKKQIPAIIHTLLIEKGQYACLSFNLSNTVADWQGIHDKVKTWDQFETVIAYYHPQLDVSLINPSNEEHWLRIESLAPYELMVVFTKAITAPQAGEEERFLADFKAICNGFDQIHESQYTANPKVASSPPATLTSQAESPAHPADDVIGKKPDMSGQAKKKRITPQYGVQVSNELFHNGNVEAWRNIIESYEHAHLGTTILLFHNGQRIKHISSLFKWGKVKVGDSIFFSIVGEEIKNVAKLKKYLSQGASHNFHAFIKKDVNVTLNLF